MRTVLYLKPETVSAGRRKFLYHLSEIYELKEGMCTNGFYFYRCGFFYRCFTFEYPLYDVL